MITKNTNTSSPAEAARLVKVFERELADLLKEPKASDRDQRVDLYIREIARYRAMASPPEIGADQIGMLELLSIADDLSIRSKSDETAAQALAAAGLAHFAPLRHPRSTIRGTASITQAGIDYLANLAAGEEQHGP